MNIPENKKPRKVLVAGAGISGLTSALALAQNGFRAEVFEQAPNISEVGAGIQLSPNASRILIHLGLGDALKEHAVIPAELKIFNAKSDRQLSSIPLAKIAQARYGAPYYVIHRADLQSLLLDAAEKSPDIDLRFGQQVDEIAVHCRGVTIQSRNTKGSNGEEFVGSALIGADGLRSYFRSRIIGDGEPEFAGYVAWRGMVPTKDAPDALRAPFTGLWLNSKAHVVHYPIRGGEWINVVVIVRDSNPQQGWANPGQRNELLSRLHKLSPRLRDLIGAVDSWLTWALFDRHPAKFFTNDRVALVGDAAHPMLPFLAQGGAMAIEDAQAIAASARQYEGDFIAAFRLYENQRKQRVARVQKAARQNGKIYHLSGIPAFIRDQKIRMTSPENMLARYDWLYSYKLSHS